MKEYTQEQLALARLIQTKRHEIKSSMEKAGLLVLDRNIAHHMGVSERTLLFICKDKHLPGIVRLKLYINRLNKAQKKYERFIKISFDR